MRKPLRVDTAGFPAPYYYPAIDDGIDHDDHTAEDQLRVVFETGRIKDGQQVVFDKATVITGLSRSQPELLFPGRERTQPAPEFNECPPYDGGQVQGHKPAPFQYQQAAGHHKTHKPEVEDQQQICRDCVNHRVWITCGCEPCLRH